MAALAARQRFCDSAAEDDPFLVHAGTGRSMAPRTIAVLMRQVHRELGAAVALAAPTASPRPDPRNRRFGISVKELT